MGLKGWVFLTEIIAAIGAVLTTVLGDFGWALGFGSVLALAALLSRALSLKNPGPFPYSLRGVLLLPRAQGQAIMSTATALIKPCAMRGFPPPQAPDHEC